MPTTQTPLRYPGGKSQLRKFFRSLVEYDPTISTYAEPYCGGAGIALDLLYGGRVEHIFLNDADKGIYSFWKAARDEPDFLIQRVLEAELTIEEWEENRKARAKILQVDNDGPTYNRELGYLSLYLNRTNVSGIIDGGVIGGRRQNGRYNITSRFNKKTLIKKIELVASHAESISLTCQNGIDFVSSYLPNSLLQLNKLVSECLLYLDPPYVQQGKNLYLNSLNARDHEDLARFLHQTTFKFWFLTYDDDPLIRKIYSDLDLRVLKVRYSANNRAIHNEIGIFSSAFADFDF